MLHRNQRHLRGELPPMEQKHQRHLHSENNVVGVVNGTPYTPYLNTTDTKVEQPSVHAKSNSNSGNDVLAVFLLILFFGPCCLACIMQSVYRWRKRRQDRVEREIMEVTTNPTSRRMVLDEIFKGSAKLVETPSNRRRVQVKKHRRKTPEERGLDEEHDTTLEDGIPPSISAVNDEDEEICSVRGRMIICVSGKNDDDDEDDDGDKDGDHADVVDHDDATAHVECACPKLPTPSPLPPPAASVYDLLVAAQCAAGCPAWWMADGVCDAQCNNRQCNYDNGDCSTL